MKATIEHRNFLLAQNKILQEKLQSYIDKEEKNTRDLAKITDFLNNNGVELLKIENKIVLHIYGENKATLILKKGDK